VNKLIVVNAIAKVNNTKTVFIAQFLPKNKKYNNTKVNINLNYLLGYFSWFNIWDIFIIRVYSI